MNTEATIERFIINEVMMGDSQIKIDPDQSLLTSNVLDSLALIRLVNFIEEQFGVSVEDDEVIPDNFETINAIKTYLENKIQSR